MFGNMFEFKSMGNKEEPKEEKGQEIKFESLAKEPSEEDLTGFFEQELQNPESTLVPLMADAEENDSWDVLAHELKEKGMHTAPEDLRESFKGSDAFKSAVEKMLGDSDMSQAA